MWGASKMGDSGAVSIPVPIPIPSKPLIPTLIPIPVFLFQATMIPVPIPIPAFQSDLIPIPIPKWRKMSVIPELIPISESESPIFGGHAHHSIFCY